RAVDKKQDKQQGSSELATGLLQEVQSPSDTSERPMFLRIPEEKVSEMREIWNGEELHRGCSEGESEKEGEQRKKKSEANKRRRNESFASVVLSSLQFFLPSTFPGITEQSPQSNVRKEFLLCFSSVAEKNATWHDLEGSGLNKQQRKKSM
ncbi:hypothetical protein JD844_013901, partial [Phrynosoma platyrhinos]